MWFGSILMCVIGTVPSIDTCMPVSAPVVMESEDLCQALIVGFITRNPQFQELSQQFEVVDIKCFPFLDAEDETDEEEQL